MPWSGFGGYGGYGGLSPLYSDWGLTDPFSGFGAMDVFPSRTFTPALRRMETELGRLLSSVKEDDKTFQVIFKRAIAGLLGIIPLSFVDHGRCVAIPSGRSERENYRKGYHCPWLAELSVRNSAFSITLLRTGKHEERSDQAGHVSRE